MIKIGQKMKEKMINKQKQKRIIKIQSKKIKIKNNLQQVNLQDKKMIFIKKYKK